MILLFRILAILSSIAAFFQITLGGIVRVTDSGLGCPDWPLCYGQLIPPFELATLIEYSHRLSASVLGFLVIATVLVGLIYFRDQSWVIWPSISGLVLVVAAAGLGGATVLTELKWWVRLIHLALAEGAVACMLIASVVAVRLNPHIRSDPMRTALPLRSFSKLVIVALVGTFALILSGSYIVGYGAGSSCASWPLCMGSLFTEGSAYTIHMIHRYIAAIIGITILATVYLAWHNRGYMKSLGWASAAVLILLFIQILTGYELVRSGFGPDIKAIHLSLATSVWISLIILASLVYVPLQVKTGHRSQSKKDRRPI